MRNTGRLRLLVLGVIVAVLATGTARAQPCGAALPAGAGVLPTQITPVTLRVLQASLIPVPATDGFVHLAYAAQMINVGHDTATLGAIVPTDALHGFTPTGASGVVDMNGRDITATVLPFRPAAIDGATPARSVNTTRLEGGAAGIVFFDLRYQTLEDVPRLLSHRLSITFPGADASLVEQTDPIPVACAAPVVIAPPLTGSGWWDGNGCCTTISPHRGATLPVNGDLRLPEQFAIDVVQLDAADGCCTGPVKDLGSWPFFRAPILAVADGVVAESADGMPEQIPGEVTGITAQNAAGNHVIEDIGGGHFVLYAHLHTGSIPARLTAGARLARGEQLGALGNTGSSTAPHLHFQVMDRPSALDATGLPFVFDRAMLEGRVTGTASQANDEYEAGRTLTVARQTAVAQVNLMPAEGQVFGYHLR